jgi:FtsP/CotA-like multicopper oxidase with cupredoxin domain
VICTDRGWAKETSRNPEVTTDVPVGAMRAVEFTADEPGDWAIHCHSRITR